MLVTPSARPENRGGASCDEVSDEALLSADGAEEDIGADGVARKGADADGIDKDSVLDAVDGSASDESAWEEAASEEAGAELIGASGTENGALDSEPAGPWAQPANAQANATPTLNTQRGNFILTSLFKKWLSFRAFVWNI